MRARGWFAVLAAVAVLFACSVQAGTKDKSVEDELRSVILSNIKECQAGNLDASMDSIHSKSPVYASTKRMLNKLASMYELKYELVDFRYIGKDGEYTLARGTQKTLKVSGPDFRDNRIDSIYIFRKENGQWKLWQQAVLEVTYLDGK